MVGKIIAFPASHTNFSSSSSFNHFLYVIKMTLNSIDVSTYTYIVVHTRAKFNFQHQDLHEIWQVVPLKILLKLTSKFQIQNFNATKINAV